MYDRTDPRSSLKSPTTPEQKAVSGYAGADYAKFYEIEPREAGGSARTWYARGQNMIIAYTDAAAGAVLSRTAQPDEYVILLPDRAAQIEVTAGGTKRSISGFTLTIVPPGDSSVRMVRAGQSVRLFSVRSADLAAKCVNADSYATPHPTSPSSSPGQRLRRAIAFVPTVLTCRRSRGASVASGGAQRSWSTTSIPPKDHATSRNCRPTATTILSSVPSRWRVSSCTISAGHGPST